MRIVRRAERPLFTEFGHYSPNLAIIRLSSEVPIVTMTAALGPSAWFPVNLNLFPCRAKSLIWQETLLYNLSEFNIIFRDEYSS